MVNKIFDKIVFSNLPPTNTNVLWVYPIDNKHYDFRLYTAVYLDDYAVIKKWTSIGITDIKLTNLITDTWYIKVSSESPDIENINLNDLEVKNIYFDTREISNIGDIYYTIVIPSDYKINSILKQDYYENTKSYEDSKEYAGLYAIKNNVELEGKKYNIIVKHFLQNELPYQVTVNVVKDINISDYIVHDTGNSIDRVISQKAITDIINKLNDRINNINISEGGGTVLPEFSKELEGKYLSVDDDGNLVWSEVKGGIDGEIKDNSITTEKIMDNAITENKLSEDVQVKLNSGSSGIYNPNAEDTTIIDLQSVKASDLKNKTYNEVLDILLFPEYGASTGTLPVLSISNPNETMEVGSTIDDSIYSITSLGSAYKYIKNENAYISGSYAYSIPTVTTTKNSKVTFGTSTRSTSATFYTITGPTSDVLYNGLYLYKSKGSGSSIQPLVKGTYTVNLSSTSATITGVYKGGKNGSKNNSLYINADGNLSNNINGAYSDSLEYSLLTDSKTTPDHSFSTLGSKSVELYVPEDVSYTVKLTATKFNSGNNSFENDKDLTAALNSLYANESTKTFKDAAGNNYTVKSYLINTSSIKTEGKFIINMKITKNK